MEAATGIEDEAENHRQHNPQDPQRRNLPHECSGDHS